MLRLVEKSFASKQTATSEKAHADDQWDPEWIRNTFSCWLKCDGKCAEDVALIGTSSLKLLLEEGPDGLVEDYVEVCQPLIAEPMPDVFTIPSNTPETVVADLRGAFRFVWLDPGAAANRLRVALEHLLDHLGIRRYVKTHNGRSELTLHARIERYQRTEPTLGAQLMAIKWLGNTASHEATISRETLLDACEIVDHALTEILLNRSKKISKLTKKLIREHRPRKAR